MSSTLDEIHQAVVEHVDGFMQNIQDYNKVVHVKCDCEQWETESKVVVKIYKITVTANEEFELQRVSCHVRYIMAAVDVTILHLNLSMLQAEVELIYNASQGIE